MGQIMKHFMQFLRSDSAVTSIEYAIIASLLSIVIIVAVTTVGENLLGLYETVVSAFPE